MNYLIVFLVGMLGVLSAQAAPEKTDATLQPSNVLQWNGANLAEMQEEDVDREFGIIYQLPAWLQVISTSCNWQSKSQDGRMGYVRIAVGQFKEGDKMYLQWVLKNPKKGQEPIISTREIEELNGAELRLGTLDTRIYNDRCTITSEAAEFNHPRRYRLNIHLFEPGQYEFEKITRLGTGR